MRDTLFFYLRKENPTESNENIVIDQVQLKSNSLSVLGKRKLSSPDESPSKRKKTAVSHNIPSTPVI
jgi:hypothetical protein